MSQGRKGAVAIRRARVRVVLALWPWKFAAAVSVAAAVLWAEAAKHNHDQASIHQENLVQQLRLDLWTVQKASL